MLKLFKGKTAYFMHQMGCKEGSDVHFTTVGSERNVSPCEPSLNKENLSIFSVLEKMFSVLVITIMRFSHCGLRNFASRTLS
jgi:hypothetical protein